MKGVVIILIVFITFSSCISKKLDKVNINENTYAVGDMGNDSVFNGLVKFYNIKSGVMIRESNFVKGKLEGKTTEYFEDGKKYSVQYYSNGLINGIDTFYENSGGIKSVQDNYYGLNMGGRIYYEKGKQILYTFSNFEGKEIFRFHYDSVRQNGFNDPEKEYFFINKTHYTDQVGTVIVEGMNVFMYLPEPPGYDFKYCICKIDSALSNSQVLQTINASTPWTNFSIDNYKYGLYGIRLLVYDKDRQDSVFFLKRL